MGDDCSASRACLATSVIGGAIVDHDDAITAPHEVGNDTQNDRCFVVGGYDQPSRAVIGLGGHSVPYGAGVPKNLGAGLGNAGPAPVTSNAASIKPRPRDSNVNVNLRSDGREHSPAAVAPPYF